MASLFGEGFRIFMAFATEGILELYRSGWSGVAPNSALMIRNEVPRISQFNINVQNGRPSIYCRSDAIVIAPEGR
jgi:hypothetical protein